jgi:MFS family permease
MINHLELVQKYFKHNFKCHFIEGIFALIGFTLLGANTILPGLIHEIAQRYPQILPFENRLATAVGICFWGFYMTIGFFFAGFFESMTERKPMFVRWNFLNRFNYLIIALATIFMLKIGYLHFLIIFYLALLVNSFIAGAFYPQWVDFIGRQIPSEKRGILFGGRDCIGTLLGILLISLFPLISRFFEFPYNYGILFSIASASLFLSMYIFSKFKEIPYSPEEIHPKVSFIQRLKRSSAIFREDKQYRTLLTALFFTSLVTIASVSLFTMKAFRTLELTGIKATQFASVLTICLTIGYAAGMPVCGIFADRFGYKRLAYLTFTLLLITFALIMNARTHMMFALSVLLGGFVQGGRVLLSLNFPMEFASEKNRPSYIGLKSLSILPFLIMPFIGGWIADRWNYNTVFIIGSIFAAITLLLYRFKVVDPRKEKELLVQRPSRRA